MGSKPCRACDATGYNVSGKLERDYNDPCIYCGATGQVWVADPKPKLTKPKGKPGKSGDGGGSGAGIGVALLVIVVLMAAAGKRDGQPSQPPRAQVAAAPQPLMKPQPRPEAARPAELKQPLSDPFLVHTEICNKTGEPVIVALSKDGIANVFADPQARVTTRGWIRIPATGNSCHKQVEQSGTIAIFGQTMQGRVVDIQVHSPLGVQVGLDGNGVSRCITRKSWNEQRTFETSHALNEASCDDDDERKAYFRVFHPMINGSVKVDLILPS